ncbi:WhiB family transcriptional regulator [Streptosporangium sp. NPDC051023]|uniref:WhiB family transcriptional regulator n=1 Tax=Streptosporangium sp. NPDC051023 TaxID=3155410 RepID=UPI00344D1ABA
MRLRDRYGAWGIDTPRAESWRDRAACREADPKLFFPKGGDVTGSPGAETRAYAKGKKICAGCLVRPQCAVYALARDERYGLWGGMTPRQRQRLLNRMKAAG